MDNITKVEVSTRPEAGKPAVVTNLTINWENISREDERALAQAALVVKIQNTDWRKNGIPTEATVDANDYRPGVRKARGPVDHVASILKVLSDPNVPEAQKAEIRAKLGL